MSGAIGFNDELRRFTVEVDDERAERMLASELRTSDLSVSQEIPEHLLG